MDGLLDDVRGEVDVRLAPRVRVRVRLPEGMEPLEGGTWQLRAHLVPEEGKRYFIFPADYAGTLGELEPVPALELPSIGMWSVSLSHGRTVVATAMFELKDGAADEQVVTLEAR